MTAASQSPMPNFQCLARLAELETGAGKPREARARLNAAMEWATNLGTAIDADTWSELLATSSFASDSLDDENRAQEEARRAVQLAVSPRRRAAANLRLGHALTGDVAEGPLRDAHQQFLALEGPVGPNVAVAAIGLAQAIKNSKPEEASALLQQAVLAYSSQGIDGGLHPFGGVALGMLGDLRGRQGDLDAGMRDLEVAVSVSRAAYGRRSIYLAGQLCNLGELLEKAARDEEAAVNFEEALRIHAEIGDRNDRCKSRLAAARWRLGGTEESRRLMIEVLTAREGDPPSAERDADLGRIRAFMKRFDGPQHER